MYKNKINVNYIIENVINEFENNNLNDLKNNAINSFYEYVSALWDKAIQEYEPTGSPIDSPELYAIGEIKHFMSVLNSYIVHIQKNK